MGENRSARETTWNEQLTYIYHGKLWRVHNAKDDNKRNKFSHDNYGLWKENLNSDSQPANNHLSSVVNKHPHAHTKQETPPAEKKQEEKKMTYGVEKTYSGGIAS